MADIVAVQLRVPPAAAAAAAAAVNLTKFSTKEKSYCCIYERLNIAQTGQVIAGQGRRKRKKEKEKKNVSDMLLIYIYY